MGKIFSPPKMPAASKAPAFVVPETISTPTPTAPANTPPAGSGGSDADTAPEVTPEEQRIQNILTRKRGRLGTISTSFNGILNNTTSPARKTLLGE